MATSLLSPPFGTPKISFLHASKLSSFASSAPSRRRRFNSPLSLAKDPNSPMPSAKDPNPPMSSDEDPINEGMTDDKNTFEYLYGLPPAQLNSLITKQKYARLQTESVTEESTSYPTNQEIKKEIISDPGNCANHDGLASASGMSERGPPKYITNTTGVQQRTFETASFPLRFPRWNGRYKGKPVERPPDVKSHYYFDRVIFLEDPIVPKVAEVLISQFMWLDRDDSSKPIYLYISSHGNEDEYGQLLASERYAFAIADIMATCKSKVYTIHLGMAADGLAGLLLSLGVKGKRGLQPGSLTRLYLPKFPRASGVATDMWSMGEDVDESTNMFLELLSKGTGKPTEELYRDLQVPKYFDAQQAIDYGLADMIVGAKELGFGNFTKKKVNPKLAQVRAAKAAQILESRGKANPQAPAPSVT